MLEFERFFRLARILRGLKVRGKEQSDETESDTCKWKNFYRGSGKPIHGFNDRGKWKNPVDRKRRKQAKGKDL